MKRIKSDRPLVGRRALVTGASRGIGRASAIALAEAGADVAVNYRSSADAAAETCAAVEEADRQAVSVQADVSDADEVASLVERVEEDLGPVDVLVNNAGVARLRTVEEVTREDWDEHVATNLTAAFELTQAVIPGMREQGWGRVVNVSSVAALNGGIVGPHYAASKSGLLGLTRSYARRLSGEGVTVNAVAPALVDTDMVDDSVVAPDTVPVGRFGHPEEVAAVVVLFAATGYITGQTVGVDGGIGLG